MKIPHHVFSPSNIGLPYAKEIDKYMARPGLWVQEHDVELGPQTAERFEEYIRKDPYRIHSAPYLYRKPDVKPPNNLVWLNREILANSEDAFPRKVRARLRHYLAGYPQPMKVTLAVAIPVQGGEAETSYFALGCTYIPMRIWKVILPKVFDIDWVMLDTRISEACMLLGQKALVHWDCVASHWHV